MRIAVHDPPVDDAIAQHPARRALSLAGGEDHELLFTADPAHTEAIRALATRRGVRVTALGRVESGSGAVCLDGEWPRALFDHWGQA